MFGRWKRKEGFWWKTWQLYKDVGPYGGLIQRVGGALGIGQGRRQARKAKNKQ